MHRGLQHLDWNVLINRLTSRVCIIYFFKLHSLSSITTFFLTSLLPRKEHSLIFISCVTEQETTNVFSRDFFFPSSWANWNPFKEGQTVLSALLVTLLRRKWNECHFRIWICYVSLLTKMSKHSWNYLSPINDKNFEVGWKIIEQSGQYIVPTKLFFLISQKFVFHSQKKKEKTHNLILTNLIITFWSTK